jgi:hypothetical protein
MKVLDIRDMPGFDPKVPNGTDSVTGKRVYFGQPRQASTMSIPTVCCADHGAMLCVAKNDAGKIWRCPTCNEGAFVR